MVSNLSDLEKAILGSARESVAEAINKNLTGYNTSLHALCNQVVNSHEDELRMIIENGFSAVLKSKDFEASVQLAFQHKLAKLLITKLEGTVEKCVETLRSNPVMRAKMTLAIEEILNETKFKT